MASSNNLMTMEQQPWIFRSTCTDPWLSEIFARDTEILTKALQNSISNQSENHSSDLFNPFQHHHPEPTTTVANQVQTQSPTVSGGSETETAVSKQKKTTGGVGVNLGKGTKRKSRASKRMTTTYIAADPENFRQMVQQVTGVRFGGDRRVPFVPIVKPEPHRPCNFNMQTSFLPTLDTSAFLLDQINHHPMSLAPDLMAQPSAADGIPPPPPQSQSERVVCDEGSACTFDFDFFCNFPILESNVI